MGRFALIWAWVWLAACGSAAPAAPVSPWDMSSGATDDADGSDSAAAAAATDGSVAGLADSAPGPAAADVLPADSSTQQAEVTGDLESTSDGGANADGARAGSVDGAVDSLSDAMTADSADAADVQPQPPDAADVEAATVDAVPTDSGAVADSVAPAADACAGTACGADCCAAGSLCLSGSCVACTSLPPSGNATIDTSRIEACLGQSGSAVLAAGTFTVSHGLTLPVGATLKAEKPKQAVLQLAAGNPDNHLLTVKDNGRVSGLVLDAMDKLVAGNEAVVHITGSQALVDGNEIRSTKAQGAKHRGAGIYFIGASGKDSKAEGNDIHDLFYGVIFAWMLDAAHPNTAQGNQIRDNACDSVTFAGFGRAVGNTIFHNGWDCQNGPIPGGGIYCLDNAKGAEILDNTIYDNCGMGIDIDHCQGLVITGNKVWNPGYRWDGWAPWCNAFGAITVVDSSGFTISGNVAENNDRPGNSFVGLKDVNGLFSASGKAAFSDLPSGANQVIAFVLARRKGAAAPKATGSTISGNQFRAACKAGLGCVGLGWFASRNTGYDGSAWQPNSFTGNDPFGSQIGSKRCGGNWYAGNSVCSAGSPAPCNGDDHQHNPPQGDAYRNDKCNNY